MKHDLLAPSLHPLAVPSEPRLQVVLIVGQPAGPAADIHSSHNRSNTHCAGDDSGQVAG